MQDRDNHDFEGLRFQDILNLSLIFVKTFDAALFSKRSEYGKVIHFS